jgi:hypothetical protein
MKKIIIVLSGLFLTLTMQAQDRTQPKAGPSPVIKINKPQTFTLPNGLQVMIVENHKLPRVSFSLNIDNNPYSEGAKKGVANLTSSLIGNGSKKISKDAFNEEIAKEIMTISSPMDELEIMRNKTGDPDMQIEDLTVGMFKQGVEDEFEK